MRNTPSDDAAVSTAAMQEIYLRAFADAVQQCAPIRGTICTAARLHG